jgi:hypothetical protein
MGTLADRSTEPRGATAVTRPTVTVFGLDVRCAEPPALLAAAVAAATGRQLELTVYPHDAASPHWPGGEIVCDERHPDGTASFRIEHHPEAGYLIEGPTYGRHLLSLDGQRLRCSPGAQPDAWQRLLVAQVLPFAAVLQGLEAIHASAVVHEGRAIAIAGPSHAGKTSLALALCRRGADFLADDVLALEARPQELVGHPGTPVVGLDHSEAQRLEQAGEPSTPPAGLHHDETQPPEQIRAEATMLGSNERERLLRVVGARAPAPLSALFLLERRAAASGASFEPILDALPLLATTFNFVLATPDRLSRLLDVCARIAQHRAERIVVGSDVDASQLAEAIERRLERRP